MKFLSRLDDFEHIVIDGSVSGTGLSSLYLKDTATPILRIGNNTGDSFITYDGSELSISSDVDLRLTTPTDQDVFLITSSGNIVTTQAGGTFTIGGGLTLEAITGGFLKADANGVVSVDNSTYLTNETDTLDSVTDRGATTTNAITVGGITVGDSHFIGNETTYDNLVIISSSGENINLAAANGIYFNTNAVSASNVGSNRMYLSNAGNLGINTTAPIGRIDIRGNYGRWRINGYGGMYFRNDSDTGYTRYIHPRSDGSLSFGRIADANLSGSDPDKFAASSYDQFYLDSSGTAFFNGGINFAGVNGANFVVDTDGQRIVWEHQRNGTRKMTFYHEADADTFNFNFESGNKLQINGNRIVTVNELGTAAASAATDFVAVTGDEMTGRLTLNQNVTIGGTTPANGNLVITDGAYSLGIDSNEIHSTNAMYIGTNSGDLILRPAGNTTVTNGKLGVGTTTPGYLIEATGTIRATDSSGATGVGGAGLEVRYNTTDGAGSLLAYDRGNSQYKELRLEGSIIAVREAGSEIARFDGGKLGIGTTSPSSILHVETADTVKTAVHISNTSTGGKKWDIASIGSSVTGRVGNLQIRNETDSANYVEITHDGNVGIGTETPSQKLDVLGYARATSGFVGNTTLKLFGDNTSTEFVAVNTDGTVQITAYGAGILTTDASGNVSVDTTTYIPTTDYDDFVNVTGDTMSGDLNFEDSNGNTRLTIGNITGASPYVSKIYTQNYHLTLEAKGTGQGQIRFNTGTSTATEKMRILENGNVGIGTTSPADKLHVAVSSGNYQVDGDSSGNIYHKSQSGEHRFRADGGTTNAFTIANNLISTLKTAYFSGNVGIGTTSPADSLDVTDGNAKMVFGAASSDRPLLYFQHNAVPVDGEEVGLLDFRGYNDASQDTRYVILTAKAEDVTDGSEDGSLSFMTMAGGTATQALTMRSGSVGIGTSNPAQKLDVVGKMKISDDIILAQTNGRIDYDNGVSTGALRFWSTNAGAERMRITSAGNVGIGTTSPTYRLHTYGADNRAYIESPSGQASVDLKGPDKHYRLISQPSAGGARFDIYDQTSSAHRFTISTGGNIGIGTTNPTAPLHVIGTVRMGDTSDGLTFTSGSGIGNIIGVDTGFASYNAVAIKASANTGIYLDTADNVGIGTTSPADKLQVQGNLAVPAGVIYNGFAANSAGLGLNNAYFDASGYYGIRFFSSLATVGSQTERMRITNTGNVGIGTTSPAEKLHVKGGVRVENASSGSNFRIGFADPNTVDLIIEPSDDVTPNVFRFRPNSQNAGAGLRVLDRYEADYISLRHDGAVGVIETDSDGGNIYISPQGSVAITATTSGNVGIGTTGPSAKLDIYGDSNSADNMIELINSKYDSTNTTGETGILFGWNNHVAARITAFKEGTVNRTGFKIVGEAGFNVPTTIATFRSTGRVGIGTDNPSSNLDVLGNTRLGPDSEHAFQITDDSTNNFLVLSSTQRTTASAARDIKFRSYGTDAKDNVLVMDMSAGNVGIGTSSPDSRLDVSDTSPILTLNATATSAHGIEFKQSNTLDAYIKQTPASGEFTFNVGRNSTWGGDFNFVTDTYSSYKIARNLHRFYILGYEVMRISDTSNVGIGTTSPGQKLEVAGRVRATTDPTFEAYNTSVNRGGFQWVDGSLMTKIFSGGSSGASAGIILETNTTEKMRITSSGYVGIGTTNPGVRLQVGSNTDTSNYTRVLTATADVYVGSNPSSTHIGVTNGGKILQTASYPLVIGTTSNQELFLGANNAKIATLVDGKFGIGTQTPATKLHVVGTAETRLRVGSSNASSNVVLELRDENTPTGQGTVITYNNSTGETYFNNALSTATTDFHFQSGEYGTANDFFTLSNSGGNAILHLKTTSGDSFITYEDSTNELAVASDGDLRLTTPTDQDVFFISSGGNIDMTQAGGTVDMGGDLVVSGDVGIGTASPDAPLHVSRSTNGINQYIYNSSSGQAYIALGNATTGLFSQDFTSANGMLVGVDSDETAVVWNAENTRLRFGTNNSERLSITGGGNVGIGTTAPGEKLVIAGGVLAYGNTSSFGTGTSYFLGNNPNSRDIAFTRVANAELGIGRYNGGWYETMRFDADGNVGIGTTSVTSGYKLEVSGSVLSKVASGNTSVVVATNNANGAVNAIANSGLEIATDSTNQNIAFRTGVSTRMYIKSDGNVGIGTTAPQQALHIKGSTNGLMMLEGDNDNGIAGCYYKTEDTDDTMNRTKGFFGFQGNNTWGLGYFTMWLDNVGDNGQVTASEERFRWERDGDFHADGDVIAYSTTTPSDIRLKTDVETIESASEKVSKLRGVEYTWSKGKLAGQREIGLIAQEVEAVVPEVVKEKELPLWDDSGESYKTVDYEKLVALLIESNKEMQEEIKQLKERLDGFTE